MGHCSKCGKELLNGNQCMCNPLLYSGSKSYSQNTYNLGKSMVCRSCGMSYTGVHSCIGLRK